MVDTGASHGTGATPKAKAHLAGMPHGGIVTHLRGLGRFAGDGVEGRERGEGQHVGYERVVRVSEWG